MPRVHEQKKAKVGKVYQCAKCGKDIEPGALYYSWSFRYGGTYRQHKACGYPKSSQLTQSKMSSAYAAIESLEATFKGLHGPKETRSDLNDLESAVTDCIAELESVRDEYQDSFDAMGDNLQNADTGQQVQEKIDALEETINNLQSAIDTIQGVEEDAEDFEDQREAAIEEAENAAEVSA